MNDEDYEPYEQEPFEPDDTFCTSLSGPPDELRCVECGGTTIGEACGFCGNDLCPGCFECGGGFCSKPHTQQMIDDYEDAVTGGPDEETLKRRKARYELKAIGILPSNPT